MISIACDAPGCIRGVVHDGEWGRPCKVCHGTLIVRMVDVARASGVKPRVLSRVMKAKAVTRRTAMKVIAFVQQVRA